jgi:hypothetical protein
MRFSKRAVGVSYEQAAPHDSTCFGSRGYSERVRHSMAGTDFGARDSAGVLMDADHIQALLAALAIGGIVFVALYEYAKGGRR